ncbi:MutS-like protein [Babesia caballi]|uniref:MutS-like protein n=1 Tax=Babesia caballi TaxID=5871 RepID=A0AAV4LVX9_BABCB|nr:MutS-like protein [Babesia caballi]
MRRGRRVVHLGVGEVVPDHCLESAEEVGVGDVAVLVAVVDVEHEPGLLQLAGLLGDLGDAYQQLVEGYGPVGVGVEDLGNALHKRILHKSAARWRRDIQGPNITKWSRAAASHLNTYGVHSSHIDDGLERNRVLSIYVELLEAPVEPLHVGLAELGVADDLPLLMQAQGAVFVSHRAQAAI